MSENITHMPKGCVVPMPTPFHTTVMGKAGPINYGVLELLVNFYRSQGVSALVTRATMGEFSLLRPGEEAELVAKTVEFAAGLPVWANCGDRSTSEATRFTDMAVNVGVQGVLLLDPFLCLPSTAAITNDYLRPILEQFPNVPFGAYAIPVPTGCLLGAGDLAKLAEIFQNLVLVKDGAGDKSRMREIRELTLLVNRSDFEIFCAPSKLVRETMTDPGIRADGSIAGPAEIFPAAMQEMCCLALGGCLDGAKRIHEALLPVFTVGGGISTPRTLMFAGGREFEEVDKSCSALIFQTAMRALGINVGPPRQPLCRMPLGAITVLREAIKFMHAKDPWLFEPLEKWFGVDISARLADDTVWQRLWQD